ncbi:MAG: phytanoyl-CoA hydroxylase [Oceanospirillaceae bacterium]|jgi:phytanoyl-CoA hydroxylase|tara:strand:+ start:318 stop:1175 length:858 start_codon:yes stop_codon:yes gene_type:complete
MQKSAFGFRTLIMLSSQQLQEYDQQGYLVINDFISPAQRQVLMQRAADLIESFEPPQKRSIFTTDEQERSSDDYFLESGSGIGFFFEEKAIDSEGHFTVPKQQSINKIGHAQHLLDPVYKTMVKELDFATVGRELGIKKPRAIQSMHIFKQPSIGGEVGLHQDSTFLYTEPKSCIGFWLALEDATVENGCLQALPGGHHIALKQRFKLLNNGGTEFECLDDKPWPTGSLELLEVPAGTLIILHGQLPHYSAANTSNRSRQAFTLHLVDDACHYPTDNWLQPIASL